MPSEQGPLGDLLLQHRHVGQTLRAHVASLLLQDPKPKVRPQGTVEAGTQRGR